MDRVRFASGADGIHSDPAVVPGTDSSLEIVFVDPATRDLQTILDGIKPGIQVVLLDSGRDALDQIAATLGGVSGLSAIHIISEGQQGRLDFGAGSVGLDSLSDRNHAADLTAIGNALAPGGDLMLWGCDVGQGDAGSAFVSALAHATGVDVAASTDFTGASALGGNWTLENHTGSIETSAPLTPDAIQAFDGTLANPTGQLFFRINQSNDVQMGAINNNGATATPTSVYFGGGFKAGTPQNIGVHNGNETSIAVDTAAGLVFSIGIGNNGSNDAVSVHNLNTAQLIETLEFGPNTGTSSDDIVQALALDPLTNTLYVGDWGTNTAHTGVAKFSYNAATGVLTPSTSGTGSASITTTQPNGSSVTSTANGVYLFTSSQLAVPSAYTNANAFFLDSANNKLYYVNCDTGYNTAPFSSVNGVYVVNTNGPTFTATELTSNGAGAGQFPVATGGSGSIGAHGNIVGLAVDVADGVVFFESTDTEGSANIALWWVNTTGANQTATKITLPGGVTLGFAGQTNDGGDAAGLTFDPATKQLYLTNANNDVTVRDTGAIYQLQYVPASHTVTLVNTYDAAQLVGATPSTVDSLSAPSTTSFDNLPTLSGVTGTSTHAVEQSSNLTLLTATPSATDTDGNHLASATVQVTAGTFSSNENSTADDNLTIATAHRGGGSTNTSGTISGTNISYSYSSGSEKLTLSGYDTLANYQTALTYVQFFSTGDNPTNYGSNTTRTLTTQVNDGAVGNPTGANSTTTSITIDAVNDKPVAGGAGNTVSYTEQSGQLAIDTSFTVTDPDNLNLAGATIKITAGGFTNDLDQLMVNGVSNGTIALGANTVTIAYDSATATLTLSGTDTLAHYQTLLREVQFRSTSDNPDNYGANTSRTITWALDDGSASNNLSTSVTSTINIAAVNDQPVGGGAGNTVGYTEQNSAVVIDSGLTVSDVDNLNLAGATVTVGTGVQSGDTLHFTNQNGITGSYDSSSHVLTLSGSATLANYQAALRTVTFDNQTNDNPDNFGANTTRTVTWVLNDGSASNNLSTGVTSTINITAQNDAPVAGNAGHTSTYIEQHSGVFLEGALTLTDADSTLLTGATIQVTAGGFSGDVLAANGVSSGTISYDGNAHIETISYSSATETLTITGGDTVAHYLSTLQLVSFRTSSDNPDNAGANPSRTITWTFTDGTDASTPVTSTVNITAVNDAPSGANKTIGMKENASYVFGTADFGFSDATDGGANTLLAVKITTLPAAGTLTDNGAAVTAGQFVSVADITGGKLQFAPALNGHGTGYTSFTFQVQDNGGTANSGVDTDASPNTVTFNVSSLAVGSAGNSVGYTEQATATALDSGITVSDSESTTLANATVTISANFQSGDTLAADTTGTAITAAYDAGTHVLTLTGIDTLADYQAVLRSVTFVNGANDDPTAGGSALTRTVNWVANDGSAASTGVTTTVNITAVNDAPAANAPGTHYSATEQTTLNLKNSGISVSDVDASSGTETLTISVGEGTLHASAGGSGAGVSGDGTGTLTITGTIAQINALLNTDGTSTISYIDSTDSPTANTTLSVHVDDGGNTGGGALSADTSSVIDITPVNDAPALANAGSTIAYTEGGAAITLESALTASDADSANLVGATVSLSGFFAGDELKINNATSGDIVNGGNTIHFSYNSGTGVLTLSGSDTVADYQAVLRLVTYDSTSLNPTNFGALTSRDVGWTVDDGAGANNHSAPVDTTINITAVDSPAVAQDDSFTTDYKTAIGAGRNLFNNNGHGVDSDPDNATVSIASVTGGPGATVGSQFTLTSGALVTVNADGTFAYDPNGAFNSLHLAAPGSGAANTSTTDTFTYTLAGGGSATVTLTVQGVDDANTIYQGSGGNDTITGDPTLGGLFHLDQGGDDTVSGGSGNDGFYFGAAFDGNDTVHGGGGTNDQIGLEGDYSGGVTLNGGKVDGVEALAMLPGFNYKITTLDNFVASGQTFTFWSVSMGNANHVDIDGSAELDGKFKFFMGAGDDIAKGGAGADLFYGEGGADTLTGNGGADTFGYLQVSDSHGNANGTAYDRITDFAAGTDKIQLAGVAVTAVNAIVNGSLSGPSFETDLTGSFGSGTPNELAAGHAVIFHVTGGGLSGHDFLIVNAHGATGYSAGNDYVFDVTGMTGTVTTADFI